VLFVLIPEEFFFYIVISFDGGGPLYEGDTAAIAATAPVINNGQLTLFVNVAFTIDDSPFYVRNDLKNAHRITLNFRNISTSLNGKIVTCTAVLDTGANLSCPSLTLQVQGMSLQRCFYFINLYSCKVC